MIPEIDNSLSKYQDEVKPILPDNWPTMQDGVIRCAPWIACLFDGGNAEEVAIKARTLRTAINRGDRTWGKWKIAWTKEQRDSLRLDREGEN